MSRGWGVRRDLAQLLAALPKRVLDRLFVGLCARNRDELQKLVLDTSMQKPRFYCGPADASRIVISPLSNVNNALFNPASGSITVEDHVILGHNVSLITGTHDYREQGEDRMHAIPHDGRDIVVRRGAWVGSNVTVLGPCVIGEHAVVGACALVNRDVKAWSIVGGVPARLLGTIEPPPE